jgi:hypothetical protein
MEGITIFYKRESGQKRQHIIVISDILKKNPILNKPISGVKISAKFIPKSRPGINEWFKKIFS